MVTEDGIELPSNIELFRIELESLWVRDPRGRLVRTREFAATSAPDMVLATEGAEYVVDFGHEVPDETVATLESVVAKSEPPGALGVEPPALASCVALLGASMGHVAIESGPTYLIPPGRAFASSVSM